MIPHLVLEVPWSIAPIRGLEPVIPTVCDLSDSYSIINWSLKNY